jgi:uncharacterized membrane protein YGL010W
MDIVARAKAIILSPATEWTFIEGEPGDAAGLYRNYIAILAAIPPVCRLVGSLLFGTDRIGHAILSAIVYYLLSLVAIYVVAWIVDALAPTFSGRKDLFSSLKLVAYSFTPAWIVGVFFLIPALRFLAILGLYSFYLFYLGVPVMTKAPKDKAVAYTIVALVCGVIAWIIIFRIGHLIINI